MAGALDVPVAVMETAGEGGPWGMALLAAYMVNKSEGETLEDYLQNRVFANVREEVVQPDKADRKVLLPLLSVTKHACRYSRQRLMH